MHKLKFKKWVLPTFMVMMLVSIIGITITISSNLYNSIMGDNYSYVLRNIASNDLPVQREVNEVFERPFDNDKVTTLISYYDTKANSEEQEKSLILYERTYMPNSGILYSANEKFEVTAAYQGRVTSVKNDELLGTVVEIEHSNDVTSRYSSLKQVDVKVGDNVSTGEVIGYSGVNKISSKSQNMLLFEVIVKGNTQNPNKYYDKNINEIA